MDIYWDGPDVDKAVCIIHYESGGDPLANNCVRSATGLMQVMAHLWAPHFGIDYLSLYDPEVNVMIGYKVWLIQGWGAWPNTSKLC